MTTPKKVNITPKQLYEIYMRDGKCDHYIEIRKHFGFTHRVARHFSAFSNASIENIQRGIKLGLDFYVIIEQLKRRRDLSTLTYLVGAGETFDEAVETYELFRYDPSAYSIYGARRRQGLSRKRLHEAILIARTFAFDTDDLVTMCVDYDISVHDAVRAIETGLDTFEYRAMREQGISHEEIVQAVQSCINYKKKLHKRKLRVYKFYRKEGHSHQDALEASKTVPARFM